MRGALETELVPRYDQLVGKLQNQKSHWLVTNILLYFLSIKGIITETNLITFGSVFLFSVNFAFILHTYCVTVVA